MICDKAYLLRNILTILGFAVLPILCFSQTQQSTSPIIISGQIHHATGTVLLHSPYTSQKSQKISFTLSLDEEGNFRDTLDYVDGNYTLFDERQVVPIYLSPGHEDRIEYDFENFRGGEVVIEGHHRAINTYLVAKERGRVFYDPYGRGMDEQTFKDSLYRIKEREMARLNAADLPQDFFEDEQYFIECDYLRSLYLYLRVNDLTTASPESLAELAVDYEDEKRFKNVGSYGSLVRDHFQAELRKIAQKKSEKDSTYTLDQYALRELPALVKNEYIRNSLIEGIVLLGLRDVADPHIYFADFQEMYTREDPIFRQRVEQMYLAIAQLKAGAPSPRFTAYVNAQGGTSDLEDFLGQGKYVYIDLWATWCGACVGEEPYLEEMMATYEGKNLEIISIAWQDKYESWRKEMDQKENKGIHLWAPKSRDSFFDGYGVRHIPRFILLDPEGKIVDHNAPRPSDKEALRILLGELGI